MFLLSSLSLQAFIPREGGSLSQSHAPKEALARPTDKPTERTTEFTVLATRLMLPPFPPNYLATPLRARNEERGPLTDDKIPEGDDRWLPFKSMPKVCMR